MNIVLDSNILFSILLRPDGKIASYFDRLKENNNLFVSDFSFEELNKHYTKLLKISKLSFNDLEIEN